MEILQSIALATGMAWASGMRLYAVVFSAGILGRIGLLTLPDSLKVLENPWLIGLSGVLLVVELLADKIQLVDSIWDSVHTFIRIPAGAVLAALALGDHDPAIMVAAGLLGGSLTAGVHALKAGSRALINTSPEPFSNIAASVGEDLLSFSGFALAVFFPILFLLGLTVFVILLVWLLPKVLRGVRMVLDRLFGLASSTSIQ